MKKFLVLALVIAAIAPALVSAAPEQRSQKFRNVRITAIESGILQVVKTEGVVAQYSVSLASDTEIIDKNSKQLEVSLLQIGDKLNIDGILGSNNTISARVIRDLSLPRREQKFNNLILTVPPSGTIPALGIGVSRDGQNYTVQIYSTTEILNVNGKILTFDDLAYFKIGDKLNVDGRLDAVNNFIAATVVRNLSFTRQTTGPTLSVSANQSVPAFPVVAPGAMTEVARFRISAQNSDIKIRTLSFVGESIGGKIGDIISQAQLIDPNTGANIACTNPIGFVGVGTSTIAAIEPPCPWIIAAGTAQDVRLVANINPSAPLKASFRFGIYDIAYTDPLAKVIGTPAYGKYLSVSATSTATSTIAVSISANPATIQRDSQSTLTWTSQNADTCTQSAAPATDAWSGRGMLNGSKTVSPKQTTTYSVACSNSTDSSSAMATVSVLPNATSTPTSTPPVATPSITVLSPNGGETWKVGEKYTVKWNTSNLPKNTDVLRARVRLIPADSISASDNADVLSSNNLLARTVLATRGYVELEIPQAVPAGNYFIRVGLLDMANPNGERLLAFDLSDALFTISVKPAPRKYSCSSAGACVYDPNGQYTTSNCDSKCSPVTPTSTTVLSISPSRITVNSGDTVTLKFGVPENTVALKLYLVCPDGVTAVKSGTSGPNICNQYVPLEVSVREYPIYVKNNSTQIQKAVPNLQAYYVNNPNFSVGVSSEITINFAPISAEPSVSISANPSTIQRGSQSTLAWTSQNVDTCTQSAVPATDAWSGRGMLNGSKSVSPAQTTVYALKCAAGTKSVSAQTMVAVAVPPDPTPTASISASPSSIISGASATINWSSQYAASCAVSGSWSGGKATSGSETVTPTVTATYAIVCSNNAGLSSAPASATVTVSGEITPTSTAPSIVVVSPNGGERWTTGETYAIRWQAANLPARANNQVDISLVRVDDGSSVIVGQSINNDGIKRWVVSGIRQGYYKVRIKPACVSPSAACAVFDESDGAFIIVKSTAMSSENNASIMQMASMLESMRATLEGMLKVLNE